MHFVVGTEVWGLENEETPVSGLENEEGAHFQRGAIFCYKMQCKL